MTTPKSKCCGADVRIGKWTNKENKDVFLDIEKDYICLKCMHKCEVIDSTPNEPTKEELQRADDVIGHNVSGTESRQLNPNEEVPSLIFEDRKGEVINLTPELGRQIREVMNKTPNEEVIKEFDKKFCKIGTTYDKRETYPKMKNFILQSLQKRDEEWRERITKTIENELIDIKKIKELNLDELQERELEDSSRYFNRQLNLIKAQLLNQ